MKTTFLKNSWQTQGEITTLQNFVSNIKSGTWQDCVSKVRIEKDPETRKKIKAATPACIPAGVFENGKKDQNLVDPSGYIAIDFDNLGDSLHDIRDTLAADPYTASVFVSIGGHGLCVFVKINPKKHADSFAGLQGYYFSKYRLVADPSGRNVARLRYVSYDPDAEFSTGTPTFKHYPEKAKPADTRGVYFGASDLAHVFEQIESRRVDITGNYQQWLAICFAIADHYGASGLDNFISISRFSALYDRDACEKQYAVALKREVSKKNTIATFLYYAKLSGISIISERTQSIVHSAKIGRHGSNDIDGTVRVLKEMHGIDEAESRPIVEQVYADAKEVPLESMPLSVQLRQYWKQCQAGVRRNTINLRCYKDGRALGDGDMVDIAYDAARSLNKEVSSAMICDIFKSSAVPEFNPLRQWLQSLPAPRSGGHIRSLSDSLMCDDPEWAYGILTKWLVCCVAAAYGRPSEVVLVLKGKSGAGKSHFFLNILPPNFDHAKEYLVEACLTKGNKQENAMLVAQRWIVLDDEFQSMRSMSEEGFKAIVSSKEVVLRQPYGKTFETYPKLASFAATTNEDRFLSDPTGNRRFAVVGSDAIDRDVYNSVDKLELWKEVYHLYLQDPDIKFTSDDFTLINEEAEKFRFVPAEEEMVAEYFEICLPEEGRFYSATEICQTLELHSRTKKFDIAYVGRAMTKLGYDNNGGRAKRVNGVLKRGYWAKMRNEM